MKSIDLFFQSKMEVKWMKKLNMLKIWFGISESAILFRGPDFCKSFFYNWTTFKSEIES